MSSAIAFAAALSPPAVDKRIEILRGIARSGSISQAARDAGISYKAAWQALDTLTNLAGVPLVHKAVGGAGGGGAALTAAGQQLLDAAQDVDAARQQVLARHVAGVHGAAVLGRLAVRTSMRNQMPATVKRLRKAGRIVTAELVLPGGAGLRSRITTESAELLGLSPGALVQVLCKATAVAVLAVAPEDGQDDAVNVLAGQVVRVARASSGDEVVIALGADVQMVGFAAARSGLRRGHMAWAQLDAAALALAVT